MGKRGVPWSSCKYARSKPRFDASLLIFHRRIQYVDGPRPPPRPRLSAVGSPCSEARVSSSSPSLAKPRHSITASLIGIWVGS